MSIFWYIMMFELRTYLTRISFVILTVCLVLVMGAVLFYPRISAGFATEGRMRRKSAEFLRIRVIW